MFKQVEPPLLNQREIVENKRLGSVLAHIQQQHEQLEHQNKRNRSQKMPRRQAQKTAIEQRNSILCLTWKCPYRTFLFGY